MICTCTCINGCRRSFRKLHFLIRHFLKEMYLFFHFIVFSFTCYSEILAFKEIPANKMRSVLQTSWRPRPRDIIKYNPFETTGFFTGNTKMGQIGPQILNFDPNQIMRPDLGMDIIEFDPLKSMENIKFDPNNIMGEFISSYDPNKDTFSGQFDPNSIRWAVSVNPIIPTKATVGGDSNVNDLGNNHLQSWPGKGDNWIETINSQHQEQTWSKELGSAWKVHPNPANVNGEKTSITVSPPTTSNSTASGANISVKPDKPTAANNFLNSWTGRGDNWAETMNGQHQEETWSKELGSAWKDKVGSKDSAGKTWQGEWQKNWPGLPNSFGSINEITNTSTHLSSNTSSSGSSTLEKTQKVLEDLTRILNDYLHSTKRANKNQ